MKFLLLSFAAVVAAQPAAKRVYHIQGLRSVFASLEADYPGEMDVWKKFDLQNPPVSTSVSDPLVDMTVYTSPSFADTIRAHVQESGLFSFREESSIDMETLMAEEVVETEACRRSTANSVFDGANDLTSDSFFDCFRPDTEIFSFLDTVVGANGKLLTKFDISKTVQGHTIPAYKLAIDDSSSKPAIFVQGMLHAREWLGPPTVVYTMASLLDGYRANNVHVVSMLEQYNFYFVPLVNIDGYRYTWGKDRMWRKNRRKNSRSGGIRGWGSYGVDLNRNYGPQKFFCGPGASKNPRSQTYCGTSPFSEPETAGLDQFLNDHPEIAGAMDVHTYGDMVLRPYGLRRAPVDEPDGSKLKNLGRNVADAINAHANGKYTNIRASELYVACGTMMDNMFESHGVPAITLELRGGNFVVKPHVIRIAGPEIFKGFSVFVDQVTAYNN